MQKKLFLQIFLLLIILLISITFFRVYFGNNITDRPLDNNKIKLDNLPKQESNLIYNIQYLSKDKEGNSYIINSKFGKVDSDKQEIVYLKLPLFCFFYSHSNTLERQVTLW